MSNLNNLQNAITDNLKKSTTEMLLLSLLEKEDMHIYAIIERLEALSGGACKITYPYAAIYRLTDNGYITECGKKFDQNRRRQYFRITDDGRKYLAQMKKDYFSYTGGISSIFNCLEQKGEVNHQRA